MFKNHLSEERLEEFRRVAYYYYKAGMTQEQIAGRMKMSRQRVNRILSECLGRGIVQINIEGLNANIDLEGRLERKYGLREVRVVAVNSDENLFKELGVAAGTYLCSAISEGDIIGFSRGRTVAAVAEYMPKINKENITVTQLLGSRNRDGSTAVDDIVYRFSQKLQANLSMLFAPVTVKSAELKKFLLSDPSYIEAYQVMKSCTIAVVAIGSAELLKDYYAFGIEDHVPTPEDLVWTRDVVGEVVTYLFDKDGKEVPHPHRDRIISLQLADFKKIPLRIGVAGAPSKLQAIHAALKGGYVNMLITDVKTAKLLEEV